MASDSNRGGSRVVEEVAHELVRVLKDAGAEGLSKAQLASKVSRSEMTVQRSLTWLRDQHDAPVDFSRATMAWSLNDPAFTLPLEDPDSDDLTAVVIAASMLQPLADEGLTSRINRLVEQMDARVRQAGERRGTIRSGAITTTASLASRIDPLIASTLLTNCRRGVVKIRYYSPWTDKEERHEVEPWQARIHDGTMYLRAYCRDVSETRTFRVSEIRSAQVMDGVQPRGDLPAPEEMWGAADPAYGIDHDRPGIAILKIRGPVARWVHSMQWHPSQRDVWIDEGELLERRVAYSSCREFARRVLMIIDAVESVEPAELREQVRANISAFEKAARGGEDG
jgi:predicted DNA-binding transcriptional regulator YafY